MDPLQSACDHCGGWCDRVHILATEQCPNPMTPPPVKRKLQLSEEEEKEEQTSRPPKLRRQQAIYKGGWLPGAIKYSRMSEEGKNKLTIYYSGNSQSISHLHEMYKLRKMLDKDIYDYETQINYKNCREFRTLTPVITDKEALDLLTVETLAMGSAFARADYATEAVSTIQTSSEEEKEE